MNTYDVRFKRAVNSYTTKYRFATMTVDARTEHDAVILAKAALATAGAWRVQSINKWEER